MEKQQVLSQENNEQREYRGKALRSGKGQQYKSELTVCGRERKPEVRMSVQKTGNVESSKTEASSVRNQRRVTPYRKHVLLLPAEVV